jgi:membrane protein implicated in regulation of membrane protease activity
MLLLLLLLLSFEIIVTTMFVTWYCRACHTVSRRPRMAGLQM